MIPALSKSTQRIIVGLAVSIFVHTALFWMPDIELPKHERYLPPLTAKLEPLPHFAQQATPKKKPKKKTPTPPSSNPATDQTPAVPDMAIAQEVAAASSVVAAAAEDATVSPIEGDVSAASNVSAESPTPPRPPLPKHARLRFEVRLGNDGMTVGEAVHTLDIEGDHYVLEANTRTTGLASLIKSFKLSQKSEGLTDGHVLMPATYVEEKKDGSVTQDVSATFDRVAGTLQLSNGKQFSLQADTLDIMSMLYQFPSHLSNVEIVTISITNGRDWEQHRFEIAFGETLDTPLGELHTVHFRKLHPAGKEGLEIWFAQEYRFFPVKVRHIDADGNVSAVAVITDIRVADE